MAIQYIIIKYFIRLNLNPTLAMTCFFLFSCNVLNLNRQWLKVINRMGVLKQYVWGLPPRPTSYGNYEVLTRHFFFYTIPNLFLCRNALYFNLSKSHSANNYKQPFGTHILSLFWHLYSNYRVQTPESTDFNVKHFIVTQ